MLWLFLAVVGKLKWFEGISPLHLPHKGECSDLALGRVGQVGRADQSDLSKNQYRFVSFRLFRASSWA